MNVEDIIKQALKSENSEKLLLDALETMPNEVGLLDCLGFVYVRKSDFEKAKQCLEKAVVIDSTSAVLWDHLGKVYQSLGDVAKAENCFVEAIKLDSEYAKVYYDYAVLQYAQNKFAEAEGLLTSALKLKPDYTDALYNLALVLKKQNKTDEAVSSLLAILSVEPEHIRAHFLLGKWLVEQEIYDDADRHFQLIVACQPENADILLNIITCLLEHNRYIQAKNYCEQFVKLHPDNVPMLYNLGVIATHLNELERAIQCYQSAINNDRHYFPALHNLAVLYLGQHNVETAKHYFELALKEKPDDASTQYLLNALAGVQSDDRAPDDYVRELFDDYALRFDEHLCLDLKYRVPQLLKQYLLGAVSVTNPKWTILDLGCGTGLCGEFFKSLANKLIGVDLSPKMIQVAEQKKIYDELVVSNNLDYLEKKTSQFDVIIAADVFVYEGDLSKILTACYQALMLGGFLAFSTEILKKGDFALQPTGRFAHSKSYLEQLAKKIGFSILISEANTARTQQGRSVSEYYVVLQK